MCEPRGAGTCESLSQTRPACARRALRPWLSGLCFSPSSVLSVSSGTEAMRILPREQEKVLLHQIGFLAQKRLARGVRLNQAEATALIASVSDSLERDPIIFCSCITLHCTLYVLTTCRSYKNGFGMGNTASPISCNMAVHCSDEGTSYPVSLVYSTRFR